MDDYHHHQRETNGASEHDHRRASDPVVVTTRDIYDLTLETKSTVDSLLQLHTVTTAASADHESRIRALEKWRYALPTAMFLAFASLAVACGSIVTGVFR